jgi:large subunit ribosomal protein L24
MSIAKIQSGDQVKIISGAYKGLTGQVVKVFKVRRGNHIQTKAFVSGLPKLTKYRRALPAYNLSGEMITVDRPIDISNLSLMNDKGELSKVRIGSDNQGRKIRVLKKGGSVVSRQTVGKEDNLSSKPSLSESVKDKKIGKKSKDESKS